MSEQVVEVDLGKDCGTVSAKYTAATDRHTWEVVIHGGTIRTVHWHPDGAKRNFILAARAALLKYKEIEGPRASVSPHTGLRWTGD